MKVVKLLALVVLVLAIFGVSLWLTLGVDNRPDSPEEARYNSLQELDDAIASYIDNMTEWNEKEYDKVKADIHMSVSYLAKENRRELTISSYLEDLRFRTEAKVVSLLGEQLNNSNCNYRTAVNLGEGLKFFYDLRATDDRGHLTALNDKYVAYCQIYSFLQNPTSNIKNPVLNNYIGSRWRSNMADSYLDKMVNKVENDYENYSKKMNDHGLYRISAFRDGLSDETKYKKINEAKSNYYDTLLKNFNAYFAGEVKAVDNALESVENAETVEEVDKIKAEMNKKFEEVIDILEFANYNLGQIGEADLNSRVYDCLIEYQDMKDPFYDGCNQQIEYIRELELERERATYQDDYSSRGYVGPVTSDTPTTYKSDDSDDNGKRKGRKGRNKKNR